MEEKTKLNGLIILGTASNVGKSLVTLGICRYLSRNGYSVAPFKPINIGAIYNRREDSFLIADSQCQQAFASGIPPLPEMSAVIVDYSNIPPNFFVVGEKSDTSFNFNDPTHLSDMRQLIVDSTFYLADAFGAVIIEGTGSPVELNYKNKSISNLWLSTQLNIASFLVVSVEYGGGYASLIGTLSLMSAEERRLVKGFILNFMDSPETFRNDVSELEMLAGIPCIGIIPKLLELNLWVEDSVQVNKCDLDLHEIDRWTDHLEKHIDMSQILSELTLIKKANVEVEFCT